MTPAEAKKFLSDNNVKFMLAQFVDIHGAAKAKAVPASIWTWC
jgi:glutamine synthetase